MSGFRKFRSSLHRRRRSLEAVELGFLGVPGATPEGDAAAPLRVSRVLAPVRHEPDAPPLEFSPSAEAREIGPNPIAWVKSRRPDTDN
jgi:hypothetical protein